RLGSRAGGGMLSSAVDELLYGSRVNASGRQALNDRCRSVDRRQGVKSRRLLHNNHCRVYVGAIPRISLGLSAGLGAGRCFRSAFRADIAAEIEIEPTEKLAPLSIRAQVVMFDTGIARATLFDLDTGSLGRQRIRLVANGQLWRPRCL